MGNSATVDEQLILKYYKANPHLNYSELARAIIEDHDLLITAGHLRHRISEVINAAPKLMDIKPNFIDLTETPTTFEIEPSDYDDIPPFVLPLADSLMGILNDIHIPYHDENALKTAIFDFRKSGVNEIMLNGDILDFYKLSRFNKTPSKKTVIEEVHIWLHFADALRKLFPDTKIYFKEGNHESRLIQRILERMPELFQVVDLPSLLRLSDFDIEYIESERFIKAGDLWILHGHEIQGGGTVNVARSKRVKANDNIAFGHHHITDNDRVKTLGDEYVIAYAVGCLCGLRPKYCRVNNWNHGYAKVERFSDGSFKFDNIRL